MAQIKEKDMQSLILELTNMGKSQQEKVNQLQSMISKKMVTIETLQWFISILNTL
jgi:hypothetical protein